MRHPFDRLSRDAQLRSFFWFLGLAVILMFVLRLLGRFLITDAAPSGIVSFELSGTVGGAQNILESWGETGRLYAGLSLGLDYLFLFVYPVVIGLGCALVADGLGGKYRLLATAGSLLAWSQIGAGLLDIMENFALIKILTGSEAQMWSLVAKWSALPKFLFVTLGILYAGIGAVIVMVTNSRREQNIDG